MSAATALFADRIEPQGADDRGGSISSRRIPMRAPSARADQTTWEASEHFSTDSRRVSLGLASGWRESFGAVFDAAKHPSLH
jgi:hypothetical protein